MAILATKETKMVGVEHILAVLDEVGDLAAGGIKIAKEGVGFGSIPKLFGLLAQVKLLIENIPALPAELADLDPLESAKIGQASFLLVKKIVDAAKG